MKRLQSSFRLATCDKTRQLFQLLAFPSPSGIFQRVSSGAGLRNQLSSEVSLCKSSFIGAFFLKMDAQNQFSQPPFSTASSCARGRGGSAGLEGRVTHRHVDKRRRRRRNRLENVPLRVSSFRSWIFLFFFFTTPPFQKWWINV